MLRAILNKSWRQHPTRHQLYGHLPPITKTIQVRRTRHAGHCWRSKDELITDVLLWTPTYGQAKAGRPARTYIQQLCEDTGCNPEDLPEAMNYREKWRERVRDIRASGTTWWWWLSLPILLLLLWLLLSLLLLLLLLLLLCVRNSSMSGVSIYIRVDRQHLVPYWPLCPELFSHREVNVFPLHGLFFQLVYTFFYKFHTFFTSKSPKFDDRCLFKPGTLLDFSPFRIASKQIYWVCKSLVSFGFMAYFVSIENNLMPNPFYTCKLFFFKQFNSV